MCLYLIGMRKNIPRNRIFQIIFENLETILNSFSGILTVRFKLAFDLHRILCICFQISTIKDFIQDVKII